MLLVFVAPMFAAEMMPELAAIGIMALVEFEIAPGEGRLGAMDYKSIEPVLLIGATDLIEKINGGGLEGSMIEVKSFKTTQTRGSTSVYDIWSSRGTVNEESGGESALRVHGEPVVSMG